MLAVPAIGLMGGLAELAFEHAAPELEEAAALRDTVMRWGMFMLVGVLLLVVLALFLAIFKWVLPPESAAAV